MGIFYEHLVNQILDDLEDELALEAYVLLGLLHRLLVSLAHEADLGGPVLAELLPDADVVD